LTTSHSEYAKRMCPRCGCVVTAKSAFAVHVWADGGQLLYDVVSTKNSHERGVLMHMSADRECKAEVSGYLGKLLRSLGLPMDCDTSPLDSF